MIPVVGVFKTLSDAERGRTELQPLRIPADKVNILTPQTAERRLAAVSGVPGEQPGMGKAVGAVVGGAVGMAGGAGIGGALASLLIPGVGPVMAMGIAGAALVGAIGAVGGAAAGEALENKVFEGVPDEELLVYRDALRKGRTVVVAFAENEGQASAARGALEHAGAESIDEAREKWWLGLRDVEKERYEADGGKLTDERAFRRGFEAALHAESRGKSYEDIRPRLAKLHPDAYAGDEFRRGYERGQAYLEAVRDQNAAAA